MRELVYVKQTHSVLCEIGNEILYVMYINFIFKEQILCSV